MQDGWCTREADGVDILAIVQNGHFGLSKANRILALGDSVKLLQVSLGHKAFGHICLDCDDSDAGRSFILVVLAQHFCCRHVTEPGSDDLG